MIVKSIQVRQSDRHAPESQAPHLAKPPHKPPTTRNKALWYLEPGTVFTYLSIRTEQKWAGTRCQWKLLHITLAWKSSWLTWPSFQSRCPSSAFFLSGKTHSTPPFISLRDLAGPSLHSSIAYIQTSNDVCDVCDVCVENSTMPHLLWANVRIDVITKPTFGLPSISVPRSVRSMRGKCPLSTSARFASWWMTVERIWPRCCKTGGWMSSIRTNSPVWALSFLTW